MRRLLHQIGLAAIDCLPRYSELHLGRRIYPDLLRQQLRVQRPNHMWCADSMCIQLQ